MLRPLLFLSPHFPPDSAAGTHRARILAPHLAKFGWQPTVVTVDPGSIEGDVDDELGASVDRGVRVVRVTAWPHAITRRMGFGDLGLRAYHSMRRTAFALARSERPAAVLVTTYPTYPALIGSAIKRAYGVPFVLDLQDPWVGAWGKHVGPSGRPDLRSRASRALARRLEVRAAGAADALMSVTTRTIAELVDRVPTAAPKPALEVPIGWEPADWSHIRVDARRNVLFDRGDGLLHLCAVGTLLPTALAGLHALLEAVAKVMSEPEVRQRLRVWFVGTSNERRADVTPLVQPLAERLGLGGVVMEHAPRLSYFDALRVLRDATAVLVLGSNEPHYTPSRVFPALASRRPIIARLHRASTAWALLDSASSSRSVAFIAASDDRTSETAAFAGAIMGALRQSGVSASDDAPLAAATGEVLAARVAAFLDQVCEQR